MWKPIKVWYLKNRDTYKIKQLQILDNCKLLLINLDRNRSNYRRCHWCPGGPNTQQCTGKVTWQHHRLLFHSSWTRLPASQCLRLYPSYGDHAVYCHSNTRILPGSVSRGGKFWFTLKVSYVSMLNSHYVDEPAEVHLIFFFLCFIAKNSRIYICLLCSNLW